MAARCETVGKYVLPVFKSLVARELINTYNLTQDEAAQRLGITQASISQYMNSKRAIKGTEQFSDSVPRIQAAAKIAAKCLANKEIRWDEITMNFCKLCSTFCEVEPDQTGDNYEI
jgi:predicted transcriptional regulator